MNKRLMALAFAAAASPLVTHAETTATGDGWDVGAKASTLGIGIEVRRSFGADFALRGVANSYSYGLDEDVDDVEYDGDLDLSSFGLIADWHPAGNGFRISAGLMLNRNELNVDAQPSGGTFEFDDVTYSAAEVGSAEGTADFNSIAPYIGVGYGRAFGSDNRLSLSVDAGVLFQGEPKFELDVTCGTAVPPLRCTQLQADADEERTQFEDDAKDYAYYPVLSIGLTWRIGGA